MTGSLNQSAVAAAVEIPLTIVATSAQATCDPAGGMSRR
jgi:hypothetical protein